MCVCVCVDPPDIYTALCISQTGADTACDSFNVKMECSGGAETSSPTDSDPLGFTVDVKTGAIYGTPQRARDGYRMRLRAVDAADVRTTVADWTFDVKTPPAFSLQPAANWLMESDGMLMSKYHVAETHLLPKPRVKTSELLQHPAASAFDKVVYLLSVKREGNNQNCTTADTADTEVVSALTDVATGKGAININCEGSYTAKLVARDGGGAEVLLRSWLFEVLRRDTEVLKYGPGGKGCANGHAVDGAEMDKKFSCECSGTKFTGDNCDIEASEDNTTVYIIGAVLGIIVLAAVVVFLVVRYHHYQRSRMATDFHAQLEKMKEEGLVDVDLAGDRVPRELKRGCLMLIDKLGEGAFGEVWKGLLQDSDNTIPEYMVAAKTVKEGKEVEVILRPMPPTYSMMAACMIYPASFVHYVLYPIMSRSRVQFAIYALLRFACNPRQLPLWRANS